MLLRLRHLGRFRRASKMGPVSARARSRLKASSSCSRVRFDPGVGLQHQAEGLALGVGGAGRVLDGAVGVVAGEAGRDQGQEDGLAEDQPVGAVEVLQHAVGVDGEAVDDPRHAHEEVVGEQGRVGEDDPLHAGVGDVALVPQGHVLQARPQVAPEHPGQAGQALAGDGVALVGHGRAALLPGPEGFGRLAHLGALEVADLGGHHLDGGAHRGAGPQVLGVAVAGHDLGGRAPA